MLSIYLVLGAFAGVLSGLFGVGGGVIVIPALSAVYLHFSAIPNAYVMQMAVGTSLAIMITTSLSSMYAHHKRDAVRWGMFVLMLPGLVVGSILGAITAHFLPSFYLQVIFGIFLLVIGCKMLLSRPRVSSGDSMSNAVIRVASVLIGALSSLLGVGGGTLLVPFLLRCNMDMREATGTSVACGLSVGVAATASFMVAGFFSVIPVQWSTGYIYWPAFFGVAFSSTLFAPVGAMFAHKLPRELLKRIFGLFLLLMACDMLWLSR
jgi:uncharacterized membrane protein YfcA